MLFLLLLAGAAFGITPGGTIIHNTAVCEYSDEEGQTYVVTASVSLTVLPVCGIEITPNGSVQSPGLFYQGQAGGTVNVPYVLVNTGNAPDTFTLHPVSVGGGTVLTILLYIDTNGNGILDSGEPLYNNESPPTLEPWEHLSLIASVSLPYEGDTFYINLYGETHCTPMQYDDDNVVRIDITEKGFITATKSANITTLRPGDTVTYTISFENPGNLPVTGVPVYIDTDNDNQAERISGLLAADTFPEHAALILNSMDHAVFPNTHYLVFAGESGIWKKDAAQVAGRITKTGLVIEADNDGNVLYPGKTGHLTFSVSIDANAPDAPMTNTAVIHSVPTIETNTVYVDVESGIRIVVDDTDENNHEGRGVHTDPDDLMELEETESGVWVQFVNEACNFGPEEDIINIFFDPVRSINIWEDIQVEFRGMDMAPLPDTDGDGNPDTGITPPNHCNSFITRVFLPEGTQLENVFFAVLGVSANDSRAYDYTFNRIGKIKDDTGTGDGEKVLIRIEAEVLIAGEVEEGAWGQKVPLANEKIIVYAYDHMGNLVDWKYFLTDEEGFIVFDEFGNPYNLYDWMVSGLSYRIGMEGEYEGYIYYLTPEFYRQDFLEVQAPGDVFERDEVVVKFLEDGTRLLIVPFDPAGYVYDGITGEKISGACVTLYRCTDQSCAGFEKVDPALLDVYADGKTFQENVQVSGATDNTGTNVGKSRGAFEFHFDDISPQNYGWYFVGVDFACEAASADPGLADRYNPVGLLPGQIWSPSDGEPYMGQPFYIDERITGAIAMRIPLFPKDFDRLLIEKKADPQILGIGEMIRFTLHVKNQNTQYTLYDAWVWDDLPPVLRYAKGTSRLDGEKMADPVISENGVHLTWSVGDLAPAEEKEIVFYCRTLSGNGKYINTTRSSGWMDTDHTLKSVSNIAYADFRIKDEVFTDKGIIIGRVFVDVNDNRIQDENEPGVKNVKIYTTQGRYVVTDDDGKYHFDKIRPGTHMLKVDPLTLPEGAELKIVSNRNMGNPGSAFADVFPGELVKVNFRLGMDPRVETATDGEGAIRLQNLEVVRNLATIMTDAGSRSGTLKHTLILENKGETPLYEITYSENSPYAPRKGTVYMNGASFSNPSRDPEGGFSFTFPILTPGAKTTLTYLSRMPEESPEDGEAMATVTFYKEPETDPLVLSLEIPVVISMERMDHYTLTVFFPFGEYRLTEKTRMALDTITDYLRKADYKALSINIKGFTDAIRVRPERTDYASNLELSLKRTEAVQNYLKSRLIDLRRIQDAPEYQSEKQVQTYLDKVVQSEKEDEKKYYTIFIGQYPSEEAAKNAVKGISPDGKDIYVREEIKNFSDKIFYLSIGRFPGQEEAISFRKEHFPGKDYPVEVLEIYKTRTLVIGKKPHTITENAKGSLYPKVINQASPGGTEENRRVEVEVIPMTGKRDATAKVEYGDTLKTGLYKFRGFFEFGLPDMELYDVRTLILLPETLRYMNGTATYEGRKAGFNRAGEFFSIETDKIRGNEKARVEFRFLPAGDMLFEMIPMVVMAKAENGKVISISNSGDPELRRMAQSIYLKEKTATREVLDHAEIEALKEDVQFGILYPEEDMIQTAGSTRIRIGIPLNTGYTLSINGKPAPENRIGEKAMDSSLGIQTIEYIGVQLADGINEIHLQGENIDETRTISLTGEISRISWEIFPAKPPADGKTPAYVVVSLMDDTGQVIRENAQISVRADKGDIWDEETNNYKRFTDDDFTARAAAGKATIKLSPASTTQKRKLLVSYGDIEEDIGVQFYPEQRPWILLGSIEGSAGLSDRENDPENIPDMPFEHDEDDFHMDGRGSIFGKGTVKDYTITFRYDTEQSTPENTLLYDNTPSAEDDEGYPVYGDESEPFYEAKSKERLYVKVEKELNYLMYGDYETEMGNDFEFNTYDRTLNGVLFKGEKNNQYRVKGFFSKNSQSIVRETIEGRGVSGPYFLENGDLVMNSEKITIEIRDRYNPNIIIDEITRTRHTDYSINYTDGYIIFHEPVPSYDDSFNPVLIQVIYETDNLEEENPMYGVRGELDFFGGKLTLGAMAAQEEHPEDDRRLYGVDFLYDDEDKIEVLGEFAVSENFEETEFEDTQGEAGRFKATYRLGKKSEVSAKYKKVNEGFQNLSATTGDSGYETYGVESETRFNEEKTIVKADVTVDNQDTMDRVKAEAGVEQEILTNLSVTGGARWNHEDPAEGDIDETTQVIAGVKYNPTEKIGVTLQRDQSLSGDTDSTVYPNKTAARLTYQLTEHISSYVQSEIREEADADVALTTIGLDSSIGENTTAFTKYTMDDSVSGWRNQSHIGVNHQFIVTDDFTVDAGLENVTTLSGDDKDEDYTAPRLSFTYLQQDHYKLTGKAELRIKDEDTESLFSVGGTVRYKKDYTLFARGRYFDSTYSEKNVLLGMARRPVESDKVNLLTKLRWKEKDENDIVETKYIATLHLNYQVSPRWTMTGEYGIKYTEVEDVDDSITQLVRARLMYDLTDRIDIGIHGGIIHQDDTDTYTLSYGPEVGIMIIENLWASLGYNFTGFYDRDFGDADAWARGPYVKLRLKFDENTLKKLFGNKEKTHEKESLDP